MKKWILLLAMLFIVGGAVAEEETPQPARYAPGDEVKLTLHLSAPAVSGLQLRLAWDPAVLELGEEEPEMAAFFSDAAAMVLLYAAPEEGLLTVVWAQETDVALTDVYVMDFTLRVREDACGGGTEITLPALQLMDAAGKTLSTQAEGLTVWIDAPLPLATMIPAQTPQASDEPTPTPQPAEAHVWLTTVEEAELPQATATPGQYIPSRPADASTVAPTATPAPTPPTVVIGNTPVPDAAQGKLRLRVTEQGEGFLVELLADGLTIGGLQATIGYDPAAARCTSAAFTDAFRARAMIQMVHCDDAGHIRLVFSSTEGYAAAGETIFAAVFTAAEAGEIVLSLSDVKCTNMDENLSMWQMENQQTVYTVQPMDDLTVVQSDSKGADAT